MKRQNNIPHSFTIESFLGDYHVKITHNDKLEPPYFYELFNPDDIKLGDYLTVGAIECEINESEGIARLCRRGLLGFKKT